jgi:hypothetical protein
MDDNISIKLDRTDEEILAYEVSDEALEAAAPITAHGRLSLNPGCAPTLYWCVG